MDLQRVSVELNRFLPPPVLRLIRRAIAQIELASSRGSSVFCCVCSGEFANFLPFNGRPHARCPRCRSLERHRLAWYLLETKHLLEKDLRLLHIAPEPQLKARLSASPHVTYVSGDLLDKDVMMKLDITSIDLPDGSFDAVICSHVLEHVHEVRLAMHELLRVLTPGGWAILDTPVDWALENTYEDATITGHAERRRAFGQWDHVRMFGRDLPDLLRSAGWEISLEQPFLREGREAVRNGVSPGAVVVLGRKPAVSRSMPLNAPVLPERAN